MKQGQGAMADKSSSLENVAQLNVRRVVRSGSLALHVADQLEAMIGAGSIAVGQRLPGENRLCESFGVSRTVVREAIAHLKSLGLVATRRGVGTTVVRAAVPEAMPVEKVRPSTVEEILHILELRLEIEPAMAALAAERHGYEERLRLQSAHGSFMQACAAGSLAREEDYTFHHAIAEATGNPCFTTFYTKLRHSIIPRANLLDAEMNPTGTGKYLSKVEGEHTDIVEAILAREPQRARDMMLRHLNRAKSMYVAFHES